MGTHQGEGLSQDARRHGQDSSLHQGIDAEYDRWRDQHIAQLNADFDTWKRENQGQGLDDFHNWRHQRAK